jgi:hypothetical protein
MEAWTTISQITDRDRTGADNSVADMALRARAALESLDLQASGGDQVVDYRDDAFEHIFRASPGYFNSSSFSLREPHCSRRPEWTTRQ